MERRRGKRPARGSWLPVLAGEPALRARESVEEVLAGLLHEVPPEASGFSLSDGGAGHALSLAYLAECLQRPALLERARATWDTTVDALAQQDAIPALFGGFCGPAWVASHLAQALTGDPQDESTCEAIDAAIVAHLEGTTRYQNYDLITGLVGFGVYALERWPHGASRRITELVAARLVALAEHVDRGVTWTTPVELLHPLHRQEAPEGYRNLGVAHGVPAILAYLARVSLVGALPAAGEHVLEDGVAWLLSCQQPLANGTAFPRWIAIGEPSDRFEQRPSTLAWCYGDLGIAAALLVTGECHSRVDWSLEAVRIARNCASIPLPESGVRDHGLCHGASGVAHLFARLANQSDDELLWQAARAWYTHTLDMRVPGAGIGGYASWRSRTPLDTVGEQGDFHWVKDNSFLTGSMGVALSLAAGFTSVQPSWDRALLVSG